MSADTSVRIVIRVVLGMLIVVVVFSTYLVGARESNAHSAAVEISVTSAVQGQSEVTAGSSAILNNVQKGTQSVQSVLTVLGIVIGGAWVLYTFALGRSLAGTVQIQIEPRSFISKQDKHAAVVSVAIKNIGRTLITKENAELQVVPVSDEDLKLQRPTMMLMHASLDPSISRILPPSGYPKSVSLFDGRAGRLEPGEEVNEDILLRFGEYQTAKIEVRFSGYLFTVARDQRKEDKLRRWSARKIVTVGERDRNLERTVGEDSGQS